MLGFAGRRLRTEVIEGRRTWRNWIDSPCPHWLLARMIRGFGAAQLENQSVTQGQDIENSRLKWELCRLQNPFISFWCHAKCLQLHCKIFLCESKMRKGETINTYIYVSPPPPRHYPTILPSAAVVSERQVSGTGNMFLWQPCDIDQTRDVLWRQKMVVTSTVTLDGGRGEKKSIFVSLFLYIRYINLNIRLVIADCAAGYVVRYLSLN